MNNFYDSMGHQNSMNTAGSMPSQFPANSPFAQSPMNPVAMQNMMGNPMDNEGANMAPYASMQQNLNPAMQNLARRQGATYARGGMVSDGMDEYSHAELPHRNQQMYRQGGVVRMQGGGNPMDAMAAQGVPIGGLEQAAMADPGMQAGQPMEDEEETEHPLAELAASVDNIEGMQLTFINAEEHQALMQATGEEIPPAEAMSDNPDAIMQLMQGAEGDDYTLVYLTEEQFNFLMENFGEPSINDASGLPQFFKKFIKKVLKNPIVQALAPVALNAFAPGIGSAIGGALGLGSMGTSALLGGGMGLLGGGGLKGALKGAALGGLGQMGGEYLAGGNNPFSGIAEKLNISNPFSGLGGGSGSPGFGLSSGAAGETGLNPASQATGLKVPSALPSVSSPGIMDKISGMLPSSNLGKLALGGATLLGLSGGAPKEAGPAVAGNNAPMDPSFNRPLEQKILNRVQRPEFRPDYSIAQQASDRTYFDDRFEPLAPRAAKRGGLMYANGGMLPDNMYNDETHRQLFSMPLAGSGMQTNAPMGPMPMMNQGMNQGMPQQPGMMNPMMGGMGGMRPMRRGGLASCYAAGGVSGHLLSGEGDGVSDDIDASIEGRQPAKLSAGEFIIPSRIVAELGNGSSEAGAKKLQSLIMKVDQKRRNTKDYAADSKASRSLRMLA